MGEGQKKERKIKKNGGVETEHDEPQKRSTKGHGWPWGGGGPTYERFVGKGASRTRSRLPGEKDVKNNTTGEPGSSKPNRGCTSTAKVPMPGGSAAKEKVVHLTADPRLQ